MIWYERAAFVDNPACKSCHRDYCGPDCPHFVDFDEVPQGEATEPKVEAGDATP